MTDAQKRALEFTDTVCLSPVTGTAWTFDRHGSPRMLRAATFSSLVENGFLEKSDSEPGTDFYRATEAAKAELAGDRPPRVA